MQEAADSEEEEVGDDERRDDVVGIQIGESQLQEGQNPIVPRMRRVVHSQVLADHFVVVVGNGRRLPVVGQKEQPVGWK